VLSLIQQTETDMTTITNTTAQIQALKKISGTKWTGTTIHSNLDACLTAINLQSSNSGWHKPVAVKLRGVAGIYMKNEDGSIFCEARVIKESQNKYRIEYMTMQAWNEFEKLYEKFTNEN
jgi:hypothetical protein